MNCGNGKCKPQSKSCKGGDSCEQDSDENNCCKYVFLAILQKMLEGRSRSMHLLMVKCVVSRFFFFHGTK